MSEWSIVLPWKGSVESNQPGVRISLSPYSYRNEEGMPLTKELGRGPFNSHFLR